MSILNHSDLNSDITSNIYNNGAQLITGDILQLRLINIADSSVNKLGDTGISGLLRYSSLFAISNSGDLTHKSYVDSEISSAISSIDFSAYLKKDGSNSPSANINWGGFGILNTTGLSRGNNVVTLGTNDISIESLIPGTGGTSLFINNTTGFSTLFTISGNTRALTFDNNGLGLKTFSPNFYSYLKSDLVTANRIIQFPDASGTVALTSDISGFLSNSLASGKILVGDISNIATGVDLTLNSSGGPFALSNAGVLTMPNADASTRGLLKSLDWNRFDAVSLTGVKTFTTGITGVGTNTATIGAITGYVGGVFVSYPGGSVVPTYLATHNATYFLINSSGTLVQQNTYPTESERKANLWIGGVGHPNHTIITAALAIPDVSKTSSFRQLFDAIGPINIGITCSANGSNLKFNTSAGKTYLEGVNFITDPDNSTGYPHSGITPCSFFYRTQTGAGGSSTVTDLDPTSYDNAGTITAIPGSGNQATIIPVYRGVQGGTVVQYGQTIYSSFTAAIAAIGHDTYVQYPPLDKVSCLIGVWAVKKSCTDLSNTNDAIFIPASKFGNLLGSTAGISTATFQSTYNNSPQPQATTNSTNGAIQYKRGSAADTDKVFEILNGAGSSKASILGNGNIIANSFIKSGGTIAQFLMADGSVNTTIATPEMYGAVGDGVTNDTAAFIAIPSTAKYIILKPGATYLINDECLNSLVKSNTTVEGNFAIIKRANAVKTTLTAPAALGATTITVADTTGFNVGDYVTVTNNSAATYAGKGDQENSNRGGSLDTIVSKTATTITITNTDTGGLRLPENGELAGAGQYAIGCNVVRTFNMWNLGSANNNLEWRNVIIDGNVANNAYTYDWRVNNTGALEGENIRIIGCTFKNIPSENIICSGKIWFDKCYLENTTGGIMHGSTSHPTTGTNGYWVTNCKGKNVGQHAAEAGHSNSFVTFSASVQEMWILNNNIENDLSGSTKTNTGYVFGPVGFTAGLGDAYCDGKVYVRGNRFVNFGNITSIFSNTADLNQNVKNVFIENNDFINCGDLLVRGNAITNGGGIRDIFFRNNTVTNGRLFFEEIYGLDVSNNKIKQEEDYSFSASIIGLSNINTVGHIYFKGSSVKIINNKVIGKTTDDNNCKRGIFGTSNVAAKDSGGSTLNYGYYQDIQIHGNTVRNHHEYEIGTSDQATSTARSLELVGWSVKNNNVFVQKTGSAEEAMRIDPGVACEGNKVYTFTSGQAGIRAYGVNSSGPITTCKGAIVRNNEIYGPSTSPIILTASNNDYNSIITNNILQIELADTGAGKSIISNNILLLSTMGTPYIVNEDEDTGVY